jgi:3'-phosphoadenosine 5'-phosphosulfate sulfotransferase (PAPS reductase)/FAD synthetase
MTNAELTAMQKLPLEIKIAKTKLRIKEWYDYWQGDVNVSFSGGKDSTVLLHLVRSLYPDVKAVFVDTGLEYPEIRQFVKTIDNVVWLKPKLRFDAVIKKYGYPIISKDVATVLCYAQKGKEWALNRLKGYENDGSFIENSYKSRYVKYDYLLDAPFAISPFCCRYIKESPLNNYQKLTGEQPFIALLAEESFRRKQSFLQEGCNGFNKIKKTSTPLGFWTEQDILRYIKNNNIPIAKVYGAVVGEEQTSLFDTKLHTTGLTRTGCMFCMFGVQCEKEPNRFQRMKITHPKQYDYCINKLGIGKCLDYINVNY